MCNAVRDNPERAEFVGYSTQRVRFIASCCRRPSPCVAGALAAIIEQLMNSQAIGAPHPGQVLLMTFGAASAISGPIIGAILITFLQIRCRTLRRRGCCISASCSFLVVMFAPGGIAGF